MTNGAKRRIRDSNFELLRLVAIGLVIASHFNYWSFNATDLPLGFNVNVLLKFLFTAGCIANIIFIILSGYFQIQSHFKPQKIITLILEMYFYSILCLLVAKFVFQQNVTFEQLRNSLLPFPFGNWFLVSYIILYLLSPFINKYIHCLNRRELSRFIIIYLLLFSFLPILTGWSFFSRFAVFPLGYLIGAYIKLYVGHSDKLIITKRVLVLSGLIIASVVAIYLIAILKRNSLIMGYSTYFLSQNHSPLVIAIATCIFLLFREFKIKPNRAINRLASSVLGVYLIHDNFFMREFLWQGNFFHVDIVGTNTATFIILALSKILLVWGSCLIIDQIRIILFGKVEAKISFCLTNVIRKVNNKVLSVRNRTK